jgi:hypothetical protein
MGSQWNSEVDSESDHLRLLTILTLHVVSGAYSGTFNLLSYLFILYSLRLIVCRLWTVPHFDPTDPRGTINPVLPVHQRVPSRRTPGDPHGACRDDDFYSAAPAGLYGARWTETGS